MILVVGLGNPSSEYKNTRHNVGFMILDSIARSIDASFIKNTKFKAEITTGIYNNKKILLTKPSTYMNLSGEAVASLRGYYKTPISAIIVIHDDIDLALGDVRVKCGGGSAGHNGLKSIDNAIGKEYWRIRVGVGRPAHNHMDVADYVLSKFDKSEMQTIRASIDAAFVKMGEILLKIEI